MIEGVSLVSLGIDEVAARCEQERALDAPERVPLQHHAPAAISGLDRLVDVAERFDPVDATDENVLVSESCPSGA